MIEIHVPASKSITQRALLIAALSARPCRVRNPLDCHDSEAMRRGLRQLGVGIDDSQPECWIIQPPAVFSVPSQRLNLGNAGTAVRFLAGLAPHVPGIYVIDGDKAMHTRPMPGLLDALKSLGVDIEELGNAGCPPIRFESLGPEVSSSRPQLVNTRLSGSSQELSALLMSGCRNSDGLEIEISGTLPSRPYVAITIDVLASFGIKVSWQADNEIRVFPGTPQCDEYVVEGDWSSASYPLAASWLTKKPVSLQNVNDESVQGDSAVVRLIRQLDEPGARRMDLGDTPDLVPTIAACALFSSEPTEITNVAHLRIKESDRIGGLVNELSKLGAKIEEKPDGLVVYPASENLRAATLDPTNDHRLAMAFGLVSLRLPKLDIRDRDCVAKSYPSFWEMLELFR
ncbi:MAG: 3-phosphoshikimate 1-carboxyvinyltransferase [Deltaproteobacteria bacterium]|nr:3-phosphoshikimate 1-carboxyvinyltransferase [Deltaproteobacteria bacterium]